MKNIHKNDKKIKEESDFIEVRTYNFTYTI